MIWLSIRNLNLSLCLHKVNNSHAIFPPPREVPHWSHRMALNMMHRTKRASVLFTIPWAQKQLRWSNNFPNNCKTDSVVEMHGIKWLLRLPTDEAIGQWPVRGTIQGKQADDIDGERKVIIKLIWEILRYEVPEQPMPARAHGCFQD